MKLLLEQIKYNQWAVRQYINILHKLDSEQFKRSMNSSFSSIHETLGHMLWVEELWYERWQGHQVTNLFDPLNIPPLETLKNRFTEIYIKQIQLLESYPSGSENQTISYVNFQGKRWEYSLSQLVQHLMFHSAYHRGQIATMLRQIGKVPPKTDYLIFIDEQSSASV
ncbi:MAG TPA: DinB family protein [Ignavibacteriaceae bacterium]|nr:DinB family protein [Ignavibacteriaceae bacterium]